jgi:hypothetical protein
MVTPASAAEKQRQSLFFKPRIWHRLDPWADTLPCLVALSPIFERADRLFMVYVKKLVLDVLKPHHPNGLAFAAAIAEQGSGYRVRFTVLEVDEKTETVLIVIRGEDIQFDAIADTISRLGGSVHSIDEVEVIGDNA